MRVANISHSFDIFHHVYRAQARETSVTIISFSQAVLITTDAFTICHRPAATHSRPQAGRRKAKCAARAGAPQGSQ